MAPLPFVAEGHLENMEESTSHGSFKVCSSEINKPHGTGASDMSKEDLIICQRFYLDPYEEVTILSPVGLFYATTVTWSTTEIEQIICNTQFTDNYFRLTQNVFGRHKLNML